MTLGGVTITDWLNIPATNIGFFATSDALQAITNTVYTKTKFKTEIYDVGGNYDPTNSRWKPILTGRYRADVSLCFVASTFADYQGFYVVFYKSGAQADGPASPMQLAYQGVANLSWSVPILITETNSYYELFVWHNSTAARNLSTNTWYGRTTIKIEREGP